MKTLLIFATSFAFCSLTIGAPLSPSEPPKSTDERVISEVVNAQIENPPNWLESGYINTHNAILIGRTAELPFDKTSISMSFYNRYNILIGYFDNSDSSRSDSIYWVAYPEIIMIPIAKVLDQSELKPIPDDFTTITWVATEVKEGGPRMIRR